MPSKCSHSFPPKLNWTAWYSLSRAYSLNTAPCAFVSAAYYNRSILGLFISNQFPINTHGWFLSRLRVPLRWGLPWFTQIQIFTLSFLLSLYSGSYTIIIFVSIYICLLYYTTWAQGPFLIHSDKRSRHMVKRMQNTCYIQEAK